MENIENALPKGEWYVGPSRAVGGVDEDVAASDVDTLPIQAGPRILSESKKLWIKWLKTSHFDPINAQVAYGRDD